MALTDNLLAYYKLDGDSTEVISGLNGTDTSITYSAANGRLIQGGGLNGTSSRIAIPQQVLNNNLSGTILMWVNPVSVTGGCFCSKQHDGTGTYATFSVGKYKDSAGATQTGTPGVIYWHGKNGTTQAVSNGTIGNSSWQHVAVVFSDTSCTFYINGAQDTTTAGDYSISNDATPTNTNIGAFVSPANTPSNFFFSGAIDEVGVWTRQLAAYEIAQIYGGGFGLSYPLIPTPSITTLNAG